MLNHLNDPAPLDPRWAAFLWGVLTGVLLCVGAVELAGCVWGMR